MCSVHIVAKRANQNIMAFHITILYDIYLPGGSGPATWTGTLVYIEVTSMMCSLRMHPLADTNLHNF